MTIEAMKQAHEERDFSCNVCGNKPDADGLLEHGKGCYTQDENGGGVEFIAEAEKQEPVAWMDKTGITHKHKHFEDMQPLYTHPQPKREWVGLDHDEVVERANQEQYAAAFARGVVWAEARLRKMNT